MKNRNKYSKEKMKHYRFELYEYQLQELNKFLANYEVNDYVLKLVRQRLEKVKRNLCLPTTEEKRNVKHD